MSLWPRSYPPALAVASFALLPMAVLFLLASDADSFFLEHHLHLLSNTLLLTAGTVLGAMLIGIPLAILTSYVQLPLGALWLIVLAAPLALPSYIGAFTFYAAFGPGGEINNVFGIETPSASGLIGASIVMALYTYPFVLLTTRASILSQDASLLNVARTLGMSLPRAIMSITLPRAMPAIATGSLLAALYSISDFGTPAILGVDTFTRDIYIEYNAFGLAKAAVLSIQLLCLVTLVLFLESLFRSEPGNTGQPLSICLKPWHITFVFLTVIPVAVLAIMLPLAIFTLWLIRDGSGDFDYQIAWNSTYVSILAATFAVLLALPVAYAAIAGPVGRLFERVTYFGFGIPGIVMGTALVYLSLQLPALYQTLAILVAAYVLRFLPLAVGTVRASAENIDSSMTKAARILGAGPLEVFRRVLLPLTMPGVIAGGALVFLESMRELPATLLLSPAGFETLATYLWRVYEAGYFGRAAIPGLLLVVMSGFGLALLLMGERRTEFGLTNKK